MTQRSLDNVVSHIRGLASLPPNVESTDAQLLERYVACHDEAAFAALVRRHGRLMRVVCRHVLRREEDIDDAVQATLLVLARKAGSIRKRTSLASWLHGVAFRTALNARKTATRRKAYEKHGPKRAPEEPATEAALHELQALLDEEVERLPEKLRAPFVLCCLEGMSKAEAARELGWKEGTVSGQVARARERLRLRLARRGVLFSAAMCATALGVDNSSAAVPPAIVRDVLASAAGRSSNISAQATALADGMVACLGMSQLKAGLAPFLVLSVLATGVGLTLARQEGQTQKEALTAATPAVNPPTPLTEQQARTDRYGDPLPAGAQMRLGTMRWRHNNWSTGLAFAKDGQFVISSGIDGTVRYWDSATGRLCRTILSSDSNLDAMTLSADGKVLATAGISYPGKHTADEMMGHLRIWDALTGKPLRSIDKMKWHPHDLALSPDGKVLAAPAADVTIALWDTATSTERLRIPIDDEMLSFISFSPDARTLAATRFNVKQDKVRIGIWDTANGKEVRTFPVGEYFQFTSAVFSPDGKSLAALATRSSERRGAEVDIVLWDVASGKLVALPVQKKESGRGLAFSPDGRTVAAVIDKAILLWGPSTGNQRRFPVQCMSRDISRLVFSPDGKSLAGAGPDPVVHLWDLATGRELQKETEAHSGSIEKVVFSRDARLLATASDDHSVRVWETSTGRQRFNLEGHQGQVRGLALSPDGKILASSGFDNTVREWDMTTGKELRKLPGHGKGGMLRSLAFSLDAKTLASWGDEGSLHVWETSTGRQLLGCWPRLSGVPDLSPVKAEQRRNKPDGTSFDRSALTANGEKLVVLAAGGIHITDVATGKELSVTPCNDFRYFHLALSPDGRLLAYSNDDLHGVVVELASGKEVLKIGGLSNLNSLVFSPDGRCLAANIGWFQGTIRLWDLRTGQGLTELHASCGAHCLAFSPDGSKLAAGLTNSTAVIWDVQAIKASEPQPRQKLTRGDFDRYWEQLAGDDATKAYSACWALRADPAQTVAYLKERLRAVAEPDPNDVKQLIAELDSKQFSVREKASIQLSQFSNLVEPVLRQALAKSPSPEAIRRLQALLAARPTLARTAEDLRRLRAIQVLEWIGSVDACHVLQALTEGMPASIQTQEAKAALARLAK